MIEYNDKSTVSLRRQEWTILIEVPGLGYHDYTRLMGQFSDVLRNYEKYVPPEEDN